MRLFKADLHIHSCLSPCGDLDMSPRNVLAMAESKGVEIIAITDHNSTLNVAAFERVAEEYGITVIGGAEVTTREEIHCVTLFPGNEELKEFQKYLEYHISRIPLAPRLFGNQFVIDHNDTILDEVDYLLITGLEQSVNQVEQIVHQLGGLFIPAHIDRARYSILSQLGFLPPQLVCDALEVSRYANIEDLRKKTPGVDNSILITSSDAHFPGDVGASPSTFLLELPTFAEIALALSNQRGRQHVIL